MSGLASARNNRILRPSISLSFRGADGQITRHDVWREDRIRQGGALWLVLDFGRMERWVSKINPETGLVDNGDWHPQGKYVIQMQRITDDGEGMAEPHDFVVESPDPADRGDLPYDPFFAPVSFKDAELDPVSPRRLLPIEDAIGPELPPRPPSPPLIVHGGADVHEWEGPDPDCPLCNGTGILPMDHDGPGVPCACA